LDKESLLPGHYWKIEVKRAIKNSRYFIALFSSTSVQKKGYVQVEFKFALDVLDEFPEGEIFAIPARLDDCEIPYEKFRDIERVDLFPDWNEGMQRLLRTFRIQTRQRVSRRYQGSLKDAILKKLELDPELFKDPFKERVTTVYSFITKWGSEGNGNGQFDGPAYVALDTSGNVYVADYLNDRVQKFSSDGSFITKWGSSGKGDGQFDGANGVAVDSSGNVYVADYRNNRIQKFSSTFIIKWGSEGNGNGEFDGPAGVALDTSGNVYVADYGNNRIQKFNSYGSFITKWGSKGNGNGQFNEPIGVALDTSGNAYVADYRNSRIQLFYPYGF
jgi:hypothetical protein